MYVAVPHHLHETIYCDVLAAGKDLLAEKPFGIDLDAAERIQAAADASGRFVRCSSEFPFMPGAQRAFEFVRDGMCGRILEALSGFHHSSDLDPTKPANWKRLSATCGEIGLMGDLGMHVCHLPLRLGWMPRNVLAQRIPGFEHRPDGRGGTTSCDTWDNAQVHSWVDPDGGEPFPLRMEMNRLAPSETNSWFFQVLGTEGGVRFNTQWAKTGEVYERGPDGEQSWKSIDLGFSTPFETITGGIFETGFPDIMQQMLAAYLIEREGLLEGRFGCVRVDEAVASQRIFAAALKSHQQQGVEHV